MVEFLTQLRVTVFYI